MNPSRPRYVPTLRHILRAGTLILTVLALFTALALIVYPKDYALKSTTFTKSTRAFQASDLLALNLLTFGRRSVSFRLDRKQEDREIQDLTPKREVLEQLQRLNQGVSTNRARQLANRIEDNFSITVAAEKELESQRTHGLRSFF